MSFELVKLENLFDIQIGKTPSRSNLEYWKNGTFNWLSIADMNQGKYLTTTKEKINELAVKESKIKLIPANTVVLSYKLSIGKVGITQNKMFTNEAIASLIPLSDKVDVNYLYWVLQHIDLTADSDRAAMGSTLNKAKLKEIKIPLPPIQEQKRIAEILDKADEIRTQRKQSIQKLDDLLQATFIEMFGDPVSNSKNHKKMKIIDVLQKLTDGTHHSPNNIENGVPYITAKHIKEGYIDFYSKPTYISMEDHKNIYSRCDPKKGDILYIKDGATTGIAAINNFDFEFSLLSSVALLRPNYNLITSEYLEVWLNHKTVKKSIVNNMGGAAIKRLTLAKIKELEIVVPNIEAQKQFAQIAQSIETQKQLLEQQLNEYERLFQSLQQRAFNGEL